MVREGGEGALPVTAGALVPPPPRHDPPILMRVRFLRPGGRRAAGERSPSDVERRKRARGRGSEPVMGVRSTAVAAVGDDESWD